MTEHRLAPTYRLISSHLPTYGSGFQGMQVITACSCCETRPVEGYGGWWAWHLAHALDDAAVLPAPAADKVTRTMRTLHVTATRDIPEGHTDQRVRYEYNGDTWQAWLISYGQGDAGDEAYLMRDNGERWVVMRDNITPVDSAALASSRGEQS